MAPAHETGQFHLSIGTSLAIEGLLGIHPLKPTLPTGHRLISALWVNLRTLVRNYYSAMKSEDAAKIQYPDAALKLLAEVQGLPDILRQNNSKVQVVYYYQTEDDIKRQFPNASYRRPKTENQTRYHLYETNVLHMLVEECANASVEVQRLRHPPLNSNIQVAFLTHFPKDLLWKSSFERVFLLESHSGKLKTYVDWYTKLNYVKSDQPIPLNEFTVQVFGDKDLFLGQEKRIRDEVLSLAKLRKWNGSTSMSKVRADIMANGSPAIKRCFKELLP